MKLVKQVALSLLVAGLLPLSMKARSASVVQVDVLGKTWDVSYVYGRWDDLEGLLTSQPWWALVCCANDIPGRNIPAMTFRDQAVAANIDIVNDYSNAPWFNDQEDLIASPFFAWEQTETYVAMAVGYKTTAGDPIGADGGVQLGRQDAVYWAVATPHAVPLPGTLGLFGVALAGLGLARRKFSA